MKIYISVDLEGASGISSSEYVTKDGRLYNVGRKLITEDVNAAIRGAFDGGAEEVIVMDGHGGRVNLLVEDLDPRALLLSGNPRQPRFAFLDKSVDGMFLVGYHSMAGTQGGNLEHTMMSSSWHSIRVNGVPYGELAIDAELAAEAGVPVVMVSGDDKLCAEAKNWLGNVEAAMVKQGLSRNAALCLSPARGRELVYNAAKRAVERLAAGEKFPLAQVQAPATVAITYKMVPDADAVNTYGSRRLDGYTVERDYPCLSALYGGTWESLGIGQVIH